MTDDLYLKVPLHRFETQEYSHSEVIKGKTRREILNMPVDIVPTD